MVGGPTHRRLSHALPRLRSSRIVGAALHADPGRRPWSRLRWWFAARFWLRTGAPCHPATAPTSRRWSLEWKANMSGLSLPILVAVFVGSAAAVWVAGV